MSILEMIIVAGIVVPIAAAFFFLDHGTPQARARRISRELEERNARERMWNPPAPPPPTNGVLPAEGGSGFKRARNAGHDVVHTPVGLPHEPVYQCPVCVDTRMQTANGDLHESICPVCAGRFVEATIATEFIYTPRGLVPSTLQDSGVGEAAKCPVCKGAMGPVLIGDDVVDVCRACGGLWCDAGELKRLSEGRARG